MKEIKEMRCCISKDVMREIVTKVRGRCHSIIWNLSFQEDGLFFAHELIEKSSMPIYNFNIRCALAVLGTVLDRLLAENDKNYFTFTYTDEYNGVCIGEDYLSEQQVSAIRKNPSAYHVYVNVFGPGVHDEPSPMEIKC